MENAPQVEKVEAVDDFDRILSKANTLLGRLQNIDYSVIYDELRELNVVVSSNPSLQQVNIEMSKVQGAKDRVSEILVDSHRNFVVLKRVCEILVDGWASFSNKGSAGERQGEAKLKMSQFLYAMSEAEALYKASSHIMKNLDSKHESISRQVSVWHLTLKLRDFGSDNMGSPQENSNSPVMAARNIMQGKNEEDSDDVEDNDEKDGKENLYDWDSKK